MPTSKYSPDAPSTVVSPDSPPDHTDEEKHHTWVWLLALAAACIIGGAWYWHHRTASEAAAAAARNEKPPGITITVATAQKGNIGVYLDAIGTVTPVYTDSITSQVNGLVQKPSPSKRNAVHKGDPLAGIDSAPTAPHFCRRGAPCSGTRMCSRKRIWTSNATKPRSHAKPSRNRSRSGPGKISSSG